MFAICLESCLQSLATLLAEFLFWSDYLRPLCERPQLSVVFLKKAVLYVLADVPPVKFLRFSFHSLFLGITWVFGFLAVEEASLVFQYLFCIFNALQGFLIFIFHHVREPAVRKAWMALCCKGTNILCLQAVNLSYSIILSQNLFNLEKRLS